MDMQGKIAEALLELKAASIVLHRNCSDDEWHDLINRYDLLFLGEQFNVIYSVELAHSLKAKFDIDIDIEALNILIPTICSSLGMEAEPMILLQDVGNPDAKIANYSITLF